MSSSRWHAISKSQFPWEQEALDFLRARLPDCDPYLAWANFEFIADNGSVNEVDVLVVTKMGAFLVEIKSRPGELGGDAGLWTWTQDGKKYTYDNPLLLTNRKAKKLKSLLQNQSAFKGKQCPWIEPLVFLSAPDLQSRLTGNAAQRVCFRDPEKGVAPAARPGIVRAMTHRECPGLQAGGHFEIDRPTAQAFARALQQAGIRESRSSRRVGDYELAELLFESPTGVYQDWLAKHSKQGSKRLVRIYLTAKQASAEDRDIVARAADREYRLMEALEHPGILRVEDSTESELGPALRFRFPADAVRLDLFIEQEGTRLNAGTRVTLLRKIAEAVQYAHGKRTFHRALSPQSILVRQDGDGVHVLIHNWMTGDRVSGSSNSTRVNATLHASQFVDDKSAVYLAPEALHRPEESGAMADVFSLGTLAWLLFTGRPPAENVLELHEKLARPSGLDPAEVLNGASAGLRELVQEASAAEVPLRCDLDRFFTLLTKLEEDITCPPEPAGTVSPLDAKKYDLLTGGYEVIQRLGSGSNSLVFLVKKGASELVLKLSTKPEHNDRIGREFQTIKKLEHPQIIRVYETVEMNGLAGFTMDRAGNETLAQRLRKEGPLSIDFLERFGEDLLDLVKFLEDKGVPNRDLKPDNLGVGEVVSKRRLRLLLFDFSLSHSSPENVHVGTRDYLDPFLKQRPAKRWDIHAERYAAAVTLHEMATGLLPKWGDGQTAPEFTKGEIVLAPDRFDPSLRDKMIAFFTQALHRDFRKRFDTIDEMRRAWTKAFSDIDEPKPESSHGEIDRSEVLKTATPGMQLVLLGLKARAANAVERINVHTIRDFLRYPLRRLYRMRGVGHQTSRELVELYHDLRARFPDEEDALAGTLKAVEGDDESAESVDIIARQVALAVSKRGAEERAILESFLGLGEGGSSAAWPSQTELAKERKVSRQRIGQAITKARDGWHRHEALASLRSTIDELLCASGGVMTHGELIQALLATRGSMLDEPQRTRTASVITRAAVEAELRESEPAFCEYRRENGILIAKVPALCDYAKALGKAADALAKEDPIPTPVHSLDALRAVELPGSLPEGIAPFSDNRLLQFAASVSSTAAVSSSLEIYPRGLDPLRALRCARHSLFAAGDLRLDDIQSRVSARYPEAALLPPRPKIDELIREVRPDLFWNDKTDSYTSSARDSLTINTSGRTHTVETAFRPEAIFVPGEPKAHLLSRRLKRAEKEGAFLALTVPRKHYADAEAALLSRFKIERCDLDAVFLNAMRAEATKRGVNWELVLQADAAQPDSAEWRKLMILLDHCQPAIETELLRPRGSTRLLVHAGLLARYGRIPLLTRISQRVGHKDGPHGLWLLLPADGLSPLPTIEGAAVPVITTNEHAELTQEWLFAKA